MNKVCIISGPTATGKTSLSINLAMLGNAHIINFDSLLFYNEINIGCAKPSSEEMSHIPHHMINIRSISNPLNAAGYIKLAIPLIEKIHQEKKSVILVGGSGFYLQALLYGMFESQTTCSTISKRSNELYLSKGIEPFIKELKENDLDSFNLYHVNDHYRIRRAVEHFWQTKTPFSKARLEMKQKREELAPSKRWQTLHIHIDMNKDEHYKVIQNRTKQMLEKGLIEEVKSLLVSGYTGHEKPLQSIGYKETLMYLQNEYDLSQLEEKINTSTRQLAKAQRTWFNKVKKHDFDILSDKKKIIALYKEFNDE